MPIRRVNYYPHCRGRKTEAQRIKATCSTTMNPALSDSTRSEVISFFCKGLDSNFFQQPFNYHSSTKATACTASVNGHGCFPQDLVYFPWPMATASHLAVHAAVAVADSRYPSLLGAHWVGTAAVRSGFIFTSDLGGPIILLAFELGKQRRPKTRVAHATTQPANSYGLLAHTSASQNQGALGGLTFPSHITWAFTFSSAAAPSKQACVCKGHGIQTQCRMLPFLLQKHRKA